MRKHPEPSAVQAAGEGARVQEATHLPDGARVRDGSSKGRAGKLGRFPEKHLHKKTYLRTTKGP